MKRRSNDLIKLARGKEKITRGECIYKEKEMREKEEIFERELSLGRHGEGMN